MTEAVVIDTNVPLVANGSSHPGVTCVAACIRALGEIKDRKLVLLDEGRLILDEYQKRLSHAGQPGVGDAFFKWLWVNQANPLHCLTVTITPTNSERTQFADFPVDPDLAGFHAKDRKFVAVAVASGVNPDVLNASDTDWWLHRDALARNGVSVRFLCPELMAAAD